MMRRFVLLIGLAYVLVLCGLGTLNSGMLALALPILVFLGAAFFFGPEPPKLKIVRILSSDRVSQGAPVKVRVAITNEGASLEQVLIEDLVPAELEQVEGPTAVLTSLAPGETVDLDYVVSGRRGYYHFLGMRVTATDALGLFQRQGTVPTAGQFSILPPILKLRQVAVRPQRTRPYSGLTPARRGGPGIEFFGVRESQPGDSMRWVNWRACARHPESSFTNEFEQECIVDITLILDIRRRSYFCLDNELFFENAVLAAAALAESFLNDGNRVGLLNFGGIVNSWTLPGYGKIQRERILRALAETGLGEFVDRLEYLPTKLFPVRSQLVLISPLLKEDPKMLIGLLAYGYRILVISPDPVSFEEKLYGPQPAVSLAARLARLERELLLRRLRQAGVHVVDWPVDRPLHQSVYASLRRLPLWTRGLRVMR